MERRECKEWIGELDVRAESTDVKSSVTSRSTHYTVYLDRKLKGSDRTRFDSHLTQVGYKCNMK